VLGGRVPELPPAKVQTDYAVSSGHGLHSRSEQSMPSIKSYSTSASILALTCPNDLLSEGPAETDANNRVATIAEMYFIMIVSYYYYW
jgi:hypothetical protein